MKKYVLTSLLLMTFMFVSAQSLFVGTYNIRNQNDYDVKNGNGWKQRCPVICDMINFESPDIFGSQEVLVAQLHDMLAGLDNYGYVGVGRDDGKEAGEYSPIFYKKSKLQLLKNGNFWLSETPDKAGSKGWDAACIRVCSWGCFKDRKTGFTFYYFNLHMDHIGVVARREAAKLVVSKIRSMAKGLPVVLTGDFNVDQKNEIFQIFSTSGVLKDTYTAARHRFFENGTFNNFESDMKTDSRIDHIFVSPNFTVNNYGVLTNSYWTETAQSVESKKGHDAPSEIDMHQYQRRNPSDHYPVMARIVYKK